MLHDAMVGSWLGHKHGHSLPSAVLYTPGVVQTAPDLHILSDEWRFSLFLSVDETAAHLAAAFGI